MVKMKAEFDMISRNVALYSSIMDNRLTQVSPVVDRGAVRV